jgi:hypothetical protein
MRSHLAAETERVQRVVLKPVGLGRTTMVRFVLNGPDAEFL